VFDPIEMLYNPKRKHTNNAMLSPVDFETRQQKLNAAGTSGIRQAGISNFNRVTTRDDLCRADVIFAATGVISGSLRSPPRSPVK